MEKTIKIDGKDIEIKSSAFTPFAYKNFTGNDLLSDLAKINKTNQKITKLSQEEKQEMWLSELTNILEMGLKLVYVMAKEKNKNIVGYEEWVSSMDDLMSDSLWLTDAIEVAISPISRQLQKN